VATVNRTSESTAEAQWRVDFRRIWAAQTVALFGAQVTALALPLAAALTLGASAFHMGLLAAAGQAPFLLCSLPAGVWVDRARRQRALLIGADLGRAALLALIPLAAFADLLRIELLYAIAFLAGVLSVLFEVAHYAYVPALVGRERLTEANGRLQVSYSAADSAGPGLAGVLIQVVSAPLAVLATAGSFLVSALLLGRVRQPERPRSAPACTQGMRSAIGEGLRALLGHPLLRPIVIGSAIAGLFLHAVRAVYVLYAVEELGLGATGIGIVLAMGGAAAVPGGLLAGWAARRFGFGAAVCGGWLIESAALLLIPLAQGAAAILVLIAAQAVGELAGAVANVNQWSLRQAVTPDHLQGRVTASHRFLVYGAYPLGSLLGGLLATALGLRPALVVCAAGALLGPLWAIASPLRSLREPPVAITEAP